MPSPSTETDGKKEAVAEARFTASLDAKDRIIHDLAAKMLKTRYTPSRTNAWIRAQKRTESRA